MTGKRIAIGTGIATAVIGVAIAAPGGAAHSLDRHHNGARPATSTAMPAWRVGLLLRSEALNRRYGLAQYALSPSSAGGEAAWQRALVLRSDALNRIYGLGAYAQVGVGAPVPQMPYERTGPETPGAVATLLQTQSASGRTTRVVVGPQNADLPH
jgi:hypothetical protein